MPAEYPRTVTKDQNGMLGAERIFRIRITASYNRAETCGELGICERKCDSHIGDCHSAYALAVGRATRGEDAYVPMPR